MYCYYYYEIRENYSISPLDFRIPKEKKKGENLDEAILVIQTIPILESDKHILSIKFHAG
jgi:hypothetical protein